MKLAKEGALLRALAPEEAARVLAGLLAAHPELVAEAGRLAAEAIAPDPPEEIAAGVAGRLRGLDIHDLAERAGVQRDGYVEPWDAVGELVDGVVEPFLADIRRFAVLGRAADARLVAAGVLGGLDAVGETGGHEVLEYVDLADWAGRVTGLLDTLGIPVSVAPVN